MKYYLGIDGGGTRTVAAVSDENGKLLLKQTGKTINFYSVGMDTARKNLASVLAGIDAVSGIKEFEAAFIGCSALDSEADDELIGTLCAGIVNAKKIKMNSDVYIALRAVKADSCPCVAVCGTGSMAACEDSDGNIHVSGGWGHILGDEGSAYSIAVRSLKHCCQLYDKGENSPITDNANTFFGVDDFRKVIDIIYSPETSKDAVAGFAAVVGELACSGDDDAVNIIRTQAQLFADTVLALLQRVSGCSVLGLYGGVFLHNEIFLQAFSSAVKEKYPLVNISLIDTAPEESALALARNL